MPTDADPPYVKVLSDSASGLAHESAHSATSSLVSASVVLDLDLQNAVHRGYCCGGWADSLPYCFLAISGHTADSWSLHAIMCRNFLLLLLFINFGCNQLRTVNEQDLTKPEPTEDFRDYLTEAHYYLTAQQENCRVQFGIDDWERWHYDDETGLLEFFNGDTLKLRTKYQQVGTVSKTSNTWLWAWANSDLSDNIKLVSNEAKKLGEQRKFERLTKQKWNADEVDGWEMTSILAYLINAKGAYRIPGENVFKYIVFTDIELMNEKESM